MSEVSSGQYWAEELRDALLRRSPILTVEVKCLKPDSGSTWLCWSQCETRTMRVLVGGRRVPDYAVELREGPNVTGMFETPSLNDVVWGRLVVARRV